MRVLFLSLALVASLIVAGTVLAPRLIDGRAIERTIATELERATGRQVAIRGPLDMHLLPRPGLSVARVVIGNPVAAQEPIVVEIDRVDLDISIMPLLRGELDIGLARLVRPVAKLAALPTPGQLAGLLSAVRQNGLSIHHLKIVDGSALVAAADGSAPWSLEGTNGDMEVDPASAAVEVDASARLQGTPLRLQLTTSVPLGSTSVPLRIELAAGRNQDVGRLVFTGVARVDPGAPEVEGSVDIASPDAHRLLDRLAALHPLPATASVVPSGQGHLHGRLSWSPARLKLDEATLDLPGAELTGSLAVERMPSSTSIALQVASNRVDLGDVPLTRSRDLVAWLSPSRGILGSIQLAVGAVSWRGQELRQVRLDAKLPGDGSVRIDRLASSLPGNGSLTLEGAISPSQAGPAWHGQVVAATDDLSGVLTWLGAPAESLPAGRLQSFSVSADSTVTATMLGIADADIHLDASHITGAAKLVRGVRPTIAIKASADRLTLDGYIVDPARLVRRALDVGVLNGLDAAIDLTIERLGWQDLRAGRVVVTAELDAGAIKLDKLVVDDVAGAHGRLVGSLKPATDSFDLAGELEVPSPLRLARLFGIELPPPLVALGTVRGSGTVRSDHGRGDVELSLDSQLLALTAEGTIGRSAGPDTLDLTFDARAPSTSEMMRRLGAPGFAEPTLGGPLDGRVRIRRRPDAPYRLDIALGLGASQITGPLTISVDGREPSIAGRLDLSRIDVQALLDTYRFLEPLLGLVPGPPQSWPGDWPTQPFDWQALESAQMDITVHATPVEGGRDLGPADLHLASGDNRLVIDKIDLPLAGGRLTGSITVDDTTTAPGAAIGLTLEGADAAALTASLRASPGLTGRLSLELEGRTAGLSLSDLVGNLDGSLAVRLEDATLDGVDLTASGPSATGLDARTTLNELSGNLRLVHGIAAAVPPGLSLALPNATGLLEGRFDLLAWILDARTTMKPAGAAPIIHEVLGPPDRLVLLGEPPAPKDASGEAPSQP